MTPRRPQPCAADRAAPPGPPPDAAEAQARLRQAALLDALAVICLRLVAFMAEALLRPEKLTLLQRAALRLSRSSLARLVEQLQALAAARRAGLPEQDAEQPRAAAAPCSSPPLLALLGFVPAALDAASSPPGPAFPGRARAAALPRRNAPLCRRPGCGPPPLCCESLLAAPIKHVQSVALTQ